VPQEGKVKKASPKMKEKEMAAAIQGRKNTAKKAPAHRPNPTTRKRASSKPAETLPADQPEPKGAGKALDVEITPKPSGDQFQPQDTRITSVVDYAKKHYEDRDSRWDIVVETMDRQDIWEIVKHTQTHKGAVKKMNAHLEIIADQKHEVVFDDIMPQV
jgi:hypothetical protein